MLYKGSPEEAQLRAYAAGMIIVCRRELRNPNTAQQMRDFHLGMAAGVHLIMGRLRASAAAGAEFSPPPPHLKN